MLTTLRRVRHVLEITGLPIGGPFMVLPVFWFLYSEQIISMALVPILCYLSVVLIAALFPLHRQEDN